MDFIEEIESQMYVKACR